MPSITHWNRLEPRTRSNDFARSLRAEIRDPLWMLARQWQVGEFIGDDAGSAVNVQMTVEQRLLKYYRNRQGQVFSLDASTPLQTRVEREGLALDLHTRLQIGRQFARILTRRGIGHLYTVFVAELPIRDDALGEHIVVDETSERFLQAVAYRAVDGAALLAAIAAGKLVELGKPAKGEESELLEKAGAELYDWFELTYGPATSTESDAWDPSQLEYQFGVAVGNTAKEGESAFLSASEYASGDLQWCSFDQEQTLPAAYDQRETIRIFPGQLEFRGMPNPRWWEFEDGRVDLAAGDIHTTDLGQMLLMKFALVASDDWFVIPYEAPTGAILRVACLIVSDVFGFHTLIRPADPGPGPIEQQWRFFGLTPVNGAQGANASIFLPRLSSPAVEGPAIEEVLFLRDEMANMAWAVETTLPNALGEPVDVAHRASDRAAPADAEQDGGEAALLRYRLSTAMHHHWTPLVPVHAPFSDRAIQLEKAALVDDGQGELGRLLGPAGRGRILNPAGVARYLIHEEEVPRTPQRVQRKWQWTRSTDGRYHLWIGRRKTAGRGRSSGLQFDLVEPIEDASL
jgi:hypothetical protein